MLPSRCCQPHVVLHVLSPTASKVGLYTIFLLCILTAYTAPHTLAINFPLVLSDGCTQLQLKLTSKGSIPRDTLHSQDGLNLGDIHFCPIQHTLNMQCIFLDYLWKLIAKGAFMPSTVEGTLELSRMTAILLVFPVEDQHEKITDVYKGLVVCHVESHLYAPERILYFMSDIEVDLKVAHDALKVGGDLGKRHAFCLFVNNYGGIMSVPKDPPYCLIYPISYVKDVEPDHFDTHNNPCRRCLHHCICLATL